MYVCLCLLRVIVARRWRLVCLAPFSEFAATATRGAARRSFLRQLAPVATWRRCCSRAVRWWNIDAVRTVSLFVLSRTRWEGTGFATKQRLRRRVLEVCVGRVMVGKTVPQRPLGA